MSLLHCVLCAFALSSAPMPAQPPVAVYLADHPYLIASSQQGWGELGLNTCAHAAGVQPLPLQIGENPELFTTVKGKPVCSTKTPLNCQPPRMSLRAAVL